MKKLIFFIIITSLIFAPSVKAQSVELSLNPPVVEILLAPNKKVSQSFTVKASDPTLTLIGEIHKATPSDDLGHMIIDPSPLDLSSIPLLITSNPELGTPLTGAQQNFTLTLEAATTDVAEDIYLALVFKTTSTSDPHTLGTTSGISALVLTSINPSGIMSINLDLEDFAPPLIHDSWLPLSFSPILKNKDQTMIRPTGKFEVLSPSGKTIFTSSLYPNLILGNSSRLIQGSVPCKKNDQDLQGTEPCNPIPLSWSPSWKNIGPHRLLLTITTQGGTKITETEKVIWIIPIRASIIIFTLIFLLSILIFTKKKT